MNQLTVPSSCTIDIPRLKKKKLYRSLLAYARLCISKPHRHISLFLSLCLSYRHIPRNLLGPIPTAIKRADKEPSVFPRHCPRRPLITHCARGHRYFKSYSSLSHSLYIYIYLERERETGDSTPAEISAPVDGAIKRRAARGFRCAGLCRMQSIHSPLLAEVGFGCNTFGYIDVYMCRWPDMGEYIYLRYVRSTRE